MEIDSNHIRSGFGDDRYIHLPPSPLKHTSYWLGREINRIMKYEWHIALAGLVLTFLMALVSLTRSVVTRDEFGELTKDVKNISEKVNLMVGRQEILMDKLKK
jgi:hypothetical protein